MTDNTIAAETFAEFRKSFFYGSRSNLNFKFIEHLSDEQANEFLQDLFREIAVAYDQGQPARIYEHVLKWQTVGYRHQKNFDYREGPFATPTKPVKERSIALLTSSGHFVAGDDPQPFGLEKMTQSEAEARIFDFLKEEPMLCEIPRGTRSENLEVRHGGYDICSSLVDANTTFPLEILATLEGEGRIGRLADQAYSFVGACSQKRLLKTSGPAWTAKLAAAGVEAVVLVPV